MPANQFECPVCNAKLMVEVKNVDITIFPPPPETPIPIARLIVAQPPEAPEPPKVKAKRRA